MPRSKNSPSVGSKRKTPLARTPEGRENQMISAAMDLAYQQMCDGTASSQVITHFLKLASTKNELEKEKLRHENELLRAKTDMIENSKNVQELYANAIKAMQMYRGSDDTSLDDYIDEDV